MQKSINPYIAFCEKQNINPKLGSSLTAYKKHLINGKDNKSNQ